MPAADAPKYYPKANIVVQAFGRGNSDMGSINKILLHSTESQSWPAYGGAGGHPTLTYNPWTHEWRQHLPITGSATALMNDGSFQTNRDHVVQIEIVGYCDPSIAAKYGHFIDDIDAQGLKDLGDFVAWMHAHYGVQIASTVKWKKYPQSADANGVRLTVAQFEAYRGILGHQHAPGNYHGDPGDIAITKIIAAARGSASPTSNPVGPGQFRVGAGKNKGKIYDSPKTVSVKYINGARTSGRFSRHIWFLQHWLNMAGYPYGTSTGFWDAKTQKLYNQFRQDAGYHGSAATGAVGLESLTKLRAKAHATKKASADPL